MRQGKRAARLVRNGALAILLANFTGGAAADTALPPKLATVDASAMVSKATIEDWLAKKDFFGPAYTAGPGWTRYMQLLHGEMKSLGLVRIVDHPFPYTRWYTTEFPDRSGWSLVSDGTKVDVASYGTQSGSTGPNGVTAPMILYDLTKPVTERPPLAALKGKIVVVKQQPFATFGTQARVPLSVPAPKSESGYCGNPPLCTPAAAPEEPPSPQWGKPGPRMAYEDYEYRSDPDSFPTPLGEKIPVSAESAYRNRDQFGQIRPVITDVLVPSGAVAAVTVMDLAPLAAQGARIHPTPRQFDVPLLMLDRVAGAKVLADAAAGKTATLMLDAHEEQNAQAYETTAVLPGKNFGTAADSAILLATHVDGPSIVEDDGALGILAVLHYYARLPQAERPRSIVVYLESRHFVPGTEGSYPVDITKEEPALFGTVVGGLALEHFGGLQFAEKGDAYAPTGRPAVTYVWGWPNPLAIAAATRAIKDQALPRAINDVPARPGVNAKPQAGWLGGGFSRYLVDLGGWPGWHISGDWPSAGFQAYYPAAKTRVSADVFVKQASVAVQLANVLMTGDPIALAPAWGYLQVSVSTLDNEAFRNSADAAKSRATLSRDFEVVFDSVKAKDYAAVKKKLSLMSADAERELSPRAADLVKTAIAQAAAFADRGAEWKGRPL